jgi:hypothetical protein
MNLIKKSLLVFQLPGFRVREPDIKQEHLFGTVFEMVGCIINLKFTFMNYKKIKTGSLAMVISAICFTACDDSSTSSEKSTASSGGTDTTLSSPIAMDTNNSAASATPSKKKRKVSIENVATTKHLKYTKDKEGVYDFSEVMPAFKSGSSDIEDYINNHIEYPQPALDDNKEGRVNVNFVVDEKWQNHKCRYWRRETRRRFRRRGCSCGIQYARMDTRYSKRQTS